MRAIGGNQDNTRLIVSHDPSSVIHKIALALLLSLLLWHGAWQSHLKECEACSGSGVKRVHNPPWWEGMVGLVQGGRSLLWAAFRILVDQDQQGMLVFSSVGPSARISSHRHHNLPKQLHPAGDQVLKHMSLWGRYGFTFKSPKSMLKQWLKSWDFSPDWLDFRFSIQPLFAVWP